MRSKLLKCALMAGGLVAAVAAATGAAVWVDSGHHTPRSIRALNSETDESRPVEPLGEIITFIAPAWAEFMMPQPAEYVAEMVVREGVDSGQKTTIYRSGLRQREVEAGGTKTGYADLSTGLSRRLILSAEGHPQALYMQGMLTRNTQSFVRTAETSQWLGETCTVWSRVSTKPHDDLGAKVCLTQDGVLMWKKVFGFAGNILTQAEAVSVTRRRVLASELAIPAEALDLKSYGDWSPRPGLAPSDEVGLAEAGGETPVLIVRRMGPWQMRGSPGESASIARTYTSPTHTLYVEIKQGKLERLHLKPGSDEDDRRPDPVRLQGVKTILGETCQLYDMAEGVSDYGEIQCLAADGVLLNQSVSSWGRRSDLTAIRVQRGGLAPADIVPPANILKTSGLSLVRPQS